MAPRKLGIDFGTSNSTCAVFDGEYARLVPLEADNLTLPSALFFSDEGDIFYGRQSIEAYLEGEEGRLMRGLKSILGTSLMDEKTLINKKYVSFTDILTTYMGHLKERAEEHTGEDIKDVVLGRPVHFHDNNPQADDASENTLRKIAEKLGFENISFQYEPIAAAFSHERTLQKEQLALVVDLGGGTSDFTVIKLSPDSANKANRAEDILAKTGVRVGGTNFDQKLSMNSFMPHLGLGSRYKSPMDKDKILSTPNSIYQQLSSWPQVNFAQTKQAINDTKSLLRVAVEPDKMGRLLYIQEAGLGHAFLQTVEDTKIALTHLNDVKADLSRVNIDVDINVTRETFEESIAKQMASISSSIDECIGKSEVNDDMISLVILTGGSSELPVINRMIARKFPAAEISSDNKFGSVGLGLTYNAA